MKSYLHEQRLRAVHDVVRTTQARTVLDLGCGPGPLLVRLARDKTFTHIVGVDHDGGALRRLRAALTSRRDAPAPKIDLIETPIAELDGSYTGFDVALLIETVEHMPAGALEATAATVFGKLRPLHVVITTPNVEFNHLLGVPSRRLRHPDHRFEWTRAEFRAWCGAVVHKHPYRTAHFDICGVHSRYGGATQLALFTRRRANTPGRSHG